MNLKKLLEDAGLEVHFLSPKLPQSEHVSKHYRIEMGDVINHFTVQFDNSGKALRVDIRHELKPSSFEEQINHLEEKLIEALEKKDYGSIANLARNIEFLQQNKAIDTLIGKVPPFKEEL